MKRRNVRLNTIIEADCIFCGIDSAYGWICSSGILGTWNHSETGVRSRISHTFSPEEIARTEEYWTPERMAEAIPAEMPEPENTSIKFTFWIGVSLACIVLADAFNSLRKWIMESQSEA